MIVLRGGISTLSMRRVESRCRGHVGMACETIWTREKKVGGGAVMYLGRDSIGSCRMNPRRAAAFSLLIFQFQFRVHIYTQPFQRSSMIHGQRAVISWRMI